jgi:hypothetical protein
MNKIFYCACMLHNLVINSGDPLPYGTFDHLLSSEWNKDERTEAYFHSVIRENLINFFKD